MHTRAIHIISTTYRTWLPGALVAGLPVPKPPVVYAAAIERTHFHLLIGILKEDLGIFVGRLKGTAASAICAMPEYAGRKHVWTAHYWEVFLFDEPAVDAVQVYIQSHNLRRNLPASPYPWIHPRRCYPRK
jgi:hypothetical protein